MMLPKIILALLLLIIYLFIHKNSFFSSPGIPRFFFSFAFTTKLLFGIGVWLIYTYYYTDRQTADIYKYFDDASYLFEQTKGNFFLRLQFITGIEYDHDAINSILANTMHWDKNENELFNDNRVIIRFNLLLMYLSQGWFHIHTLIFSFISFLGSVFIYKSFTKYSTLPNKLLFIISFFIPTFLFWSSGALKEALLVFALGFFLLSMVKLMDFISWKNAFLTLISLLLLFTIKPYVGASLLPGILFLMIHHAIKKIAVIRLFIMTQLISIFILLGPLNKLFFFYLTNRQLSFIKLAEQVKAASAIPINLVNDLPSLIAALPMGIISALFRPFFWEANNPFAYIAAIENLFLMLLPFFVLFYYKRANSKELIYLLFFTSFILYLAALIGLSTPVLGAIMRYKIPLLPFYVFLIATFVNVKKIPLLKKL